MPPPPLRKTDPCAILEIVINTESLVEFESKANKCPIGLCFALLFFCPLLHKVGRLLYV